MIYTPISFNVQDFNLPQRKTSNKYSIDTELDKFDFNTLIYDIFYSNCGSGIFVICPPIKLFNNLYCKINNGKGIKFYYYIDNVKVKLRSKITYGKRNEKIFIYFDECLINHYKLNQNIEISISINNIDIKCNPNINYSSMFGDGISITTMSKNNKFIWIKDWLTWYYRLYNITSLVLIDNNSTDYTLEELDKFLSNIDFLNNYIIVDCKFPYGIVMAPVINKPNKFYYNYCFLQSSFIEISSLNFLNISKAVFQCDIDELIYSEYRNVALLMDYCKNGIIYTNYQRYVKVNQTIDGKLKKDLKTHSSHTLFGSKITVAKKVYI